MGSILLPSEILATILLDLDVRNLYRCREVCTRFKTLIDEDVRAQYKLELAIAGMEDGPPSTVSTAKRLFTLRLRQDAWRNFAWTAKVHVPKVTGNVWRLYGNILVQSEGLRTLRFIQIPSAIQGIEGTKWIIPDVGCNIKEVALDPSQDLLLVIEDFQDESQVTCNMHLGSLSTGGPHPASTPTAMLTHRVKRSRYAYSYIIQILEGYLGVLMADLGYEYPSELLIWDWKTGKLHLRITNREPYCWVFLTSRLLLIAHGESGYNDPYFLVIDLESPQFSNTVSVTLSEVDYLCTFHYPPLAQTILVLKMYISPDHKPVRRPSSTLAAPKFSISRADRLFLVSLWLISTELLEEPAVLSLVPASTFLRAIATLSLGETRRDFAWAEWGPRGSRLFAAPSTYMSAAGCYVCGTTFAKVEQEWDARAGQSRKIVVVRDFNQLAVRRATAGPGAEGKDSDSHQSPSGEENSESEERGMRVVADATAFGPTGVFQEEVTTALPYMERVFVPTKEDGEFDAVMLAEDAMVLTDTSQSPSRRSRILSV